MRSFTFLNFTIKVILILISAFQHSYRSLALQSRVLVIGSREEEKEKEEKEKNRGS